MPQKDFAECSGCGRMFHIYREIEDFDNHDCNEDEELDEQGDTPEAVPPPQRQIGLRV